MATFADDTAIFSVARTENKAKHNLQNALTSVSLEWTRKWCIKLINSSKSTHGDFINKSTLGISIFMASVQVPYSNTAK